MEEVENVAKVQRCLEEEETRKVAIDREAIRQCKVICQEANIKTVIAWNQRLPDFEKCSWRNVNQHLYYMLRAYGTS